jgi:OFA family oxalate/formate antiporter-like MFS transporter
MSGEPAKSFRVNGGMVLQETLERKDVRNLNSRRWGITVAAVFIQIALGAIYAWSVFRVPLAKQFGWSISQVTLTFTISMATLGVSSFFGGLWMNRQGPRIVSLTAGCLYGSGVFLASFSAHKLWWLYLTYGLIGGTGLGFGYIVPVAVLVKWFPERRGLMTGIAVGGFGAGALFAAPVATRLIQIVGALPTFSYLGIAFLFMTVVGGYFMQNPPDGWQPEGWTPSATQIAQRATRDYHFGEALRTWQWWALCLLLNLNTAGGISVLSQASPMFQDLGQVSAVIAGGMVGVISIGNAFGRVFWAWVSDLITRKATYSLLFLIQLSLLWFLPSIHSPGLLVTLTFILITCYGAGYSVTPAFAADYFGAKHVGPIFGLMLMGWSVATIVWPLLFAHMREITGGYEKGLHILAGVAAVSMLIPLIMSPPRRSEVAIGTVVPETPSDPAKAI